MLSSDPRLPQLSQQEAASGSVPIGFYRRFQERFYTLWRELARNDEKLRARVDGGKFDAVYVGDGTAALPSVTNQGDENTGVFFPAANQVAVTTDGTERMRIDSSGKVGIGGSAGAEIKVDVLGTLPTSGAVSVGYRATGTVPSGTTSIYAGFYSAGTTQAASFTLNDYQHFRVWQNGFGAGSTVTNQFGYYVSSNMTSATYNYAFYTDIASGTNRWNFYAAGTAKNYFAGETYVGATTDNGAYNLQCNGTAVWGAGAYVNGSDARIKEDVAPIQSGLDVVAKLNPVTFRYKESWSKDQNIQPGFIAQELQAAMVDEVYVDGVVQQGPEYMSVAYQSLIPILTKAIQEQQQQIVALQAEVAALKQ